MTDSMSLELGRLKRKHDLDAKVRERQKERKKETWEQAKGRKRRCEKEAKAKKPAWDAFQVRADEEIGPGWRWAEPTETPVNKEGEVEGDGVVEVGMATREQDVTAEGEIKEEQDVIDEGRKRAGNDQEHSTKKLRGEEVGPVRRMTSHLPTELADRPRIDLCGLRHVPPRILHTRRDQAPHARPCGV